MTLPVQTSIDLHTQDDQPTGLVASFDAPPCGVSHRYPPFHFCTHGGEKLQFFVTLLLNCFPDLMLIVSLTLTLSQFLSNLMWNGNSKIEVKLPVIVKSSVKIKQNANPEKLFWWGISPLKPGSQNAEMRRFLSDLQVVVRKGPTRPRGPQLSSSFGKHFGFFLVERGCKRWTALCSHAHFDVVVVIVAEPPPPHLGQIPPCPGTIRLISNYQQCSVVLYEIQRDLKSCYVRAD